MANKPQEGGKMEGRYIATVIFDFDYDDSRKGTKPFEVMKHDVEGGYLNDYVTNMLAEEFEETATVTVEQQYADLYRRKEGFNAK